MNRDVGRKKLFHSSFLFAAIFITLKPRMALPTPRKDAAVNRLATSITQLTLCQVTTSEIDAATKMLDKAYQKLQGIQSVPSQRVTDLEAAIRQIRQLSCILDSCTISASYEVSQAQKALLLLPHTAKGASTSSEELNAQISPRTDDEHNLPYLKTTCKSTSVLEPTATAMMEPWPASTTRAEHKKLPKSMMIGKALLSGLWAHPQGGFTVRFTFVFLTLARVSLSVSPFFFTTLVATRRCRCLLRSDQECFRMVLCCFPHLRVWPRVCLCSSLPVVCLVYGHTMMRWHNVVTSCMNLPMNGSQSFTWVLVFGFVFVLLWWFLFVCLVWLLVSGCGDDGLLDYVQVLHQFSFVALNSRWPRVLIWNYCFCNAIDSVKRPGESHEGVGRKKIHNLEASSLEAVPLRQLRLKIRVGSKYITYRVLSELSGPRMQKVPQPSKPTWVSVQDVVLNSLRPSTQPSQLLPELSHFYQTHKHKESVLLMSLWFLLVCHSLTQNDAESPVDIFLSTSQKRSQKHMSSQKVFTSRHGLFV